MFSLCTGLCKFCSPSSLQVLAEGQPRLDGRDPVWAVPGENILPWGLSSKQGMMLFTTLSRSQREGGPEGRGWGPGDPLGDAGGWDEGMRRGRRMRTRREGRSQWKRPKRRSGGLPVARGKTGVESDRPLVPWSRAAAPWGAPVTPHRPPGGPAAGATSHPEADGSLRTASRVQRCELLICRPGLCFKHQRCVRPLMLLGPVHRGNVSEMHVARTPNAPRILRRVRCHCSAPLLCGHLSVRLLTHRPGSGRQLSRGLPRVWAAAAVFLRLSTEKAFRNGDPVPGPANCGVWALEDLPPCPLNPVFMRVWGQPRGTRSCFWLPHWSGSWAGAPLVWVVGRCKGPGATARLRV